jgi:hypothetical protein
VHLERVHLERVHLERVHLERVHLERVTPRSCTFFALGLHPCRREMQRGTASR